MICFQTTIDHLDPDVAQIRFQDGGHADVRDLRPTAPVYKCELSPDWTLEPCAHLQFPHVAFRGHSAAKLPPT